MVAPRDDIQYALVIGNTGAYPTRVDFRMQPHRMYLTAERALNKDYTHSRLMWDRGSRAIDHDIPKGSDYQVDERGEVVRIPHRHGSMYNGHLGWLRVDELNVPLNVVPLKYFTPQRQDIGRKWSEVAEEQGSSVLHIYESMFDLIKMWNVPKHYINVREIGEWDVGKTFIIDMGFPPTSDANLFRNEQLENNRYQNASQSQMVSVKLQGRPNTRYIAKTSAPRNPESNNHEVFIGLYPSEPNQNIGFSVNEDMVFVTDDKGELELSFYDSGLSGVNADYLDFLDYTYWVEILVHPNQSMTVPPDMVVHSDDGTHEVYDGNNLESGLELKPGINEITIVGKGKISFHWQNEVMG